MTFFCSPYKEKDDVRLDSGGSSHVDGAEDSGSRTLMKIGKNVGLVEYNKRV